MGRARGLERVLGRSRVLGRALGRARGWSRALVRLALRRPALLGRARVSRPRLDLTWVSRSLLGPAGIRRARVRVLSLIRLAPGGARLVLG
ncbi:hypothetical protein [Streptomyces sp. NPDC006925]|uniref:hypothetical protein n=1 Tax=Streptomyces sp. NPDC006925 TaxID=3364768 RepID=UPI0036CAF26B